MSTNMTAQLQPSQCPPWCQTEWTDTDGATMHSATFGHFAVSQLVQADGTVEGAALLPGFVELQPRTAAELEQLVCEYRDALNACLSALP